MDGGGNEWIMSVIGMGGMDFAGRIPRSLTRIATLLAAYNDTTFPFYEVWICVSNVLLSVL